ncbi:MAG: hypothetical protein IPJ47_22955 [Anaerolineales bacterium]|nr:hypothetical protein [Anaerolineales bacterium]
MVQLSTPNQVNKTDLKPAFPPSATHIGSVQIVLDVTFFVRIIYGGQMSLFIGVLAVTVSVSLGTVVRWNCGLL